MKTSIRPVWGDDGSGAVHSGIRSLVFLTHGQVDEGEDVVLDHDGEAEEDGVQNQHIDAQLEVQLPPVQMNPMNLQWKKHETKL